MVYGDCCYCSKLKGNLLNSSYSIRLMTDDSSGDIDAGLPCSSQTNDAPSDGSSRNNGCWYRCLTYSVLLPPDATVEAGKVSWGSSFWANSSCHMIPDTRKPDKVLIYFLSKLTI